MLLIFDIFRCNSGDAIVETDDDPEVIRAKYFIRDEFLVNILPK